MYEYLTAILRTVDSLSDTLLMSTNGTHIFNLRSLDLRTDVNSFMVLRSTMQYSDSSLHRLETGIQRGVDIDVIIK